MKIKAVFNDKPLESFHTTTCVMIQQQTTEAADKSVYHITAFKISVFWSVYDPVSSSPLRCINNKENVTELITRLDNQHDCLALF